MPDPDLVQALNIINIQKITKDAFATAGETTGKVFSDLWTTSKWYIILFILVFFFNKFWEKGIGSVVYHLIYFGIIAILIIIYGWAILFNLYFEVISLLAYWFAGFILRRIGIWK